MSTSEDVTMSEDVQNTSTTSGNAQILSMSEHIQTTPMSEDAQNRSRGWVDEPSISNMPAELIYMLLENIDSVAALSNLIFSCRFAKECFISRKEEILWRALRVELGPLMADAEFLIHFLIPEPGRGVSERTATFEPDPAKWVPDPENPEKKMKPPMLDVYYSGRWWDDMLALPIPDLRYMTQLCQTLHDMNYLANTYTEAQLASFRNSGGSGPAIAPPSDTERQRVLGAFYRRQIMCHLMKRPLAPLADPPYTLPEYPAADGIEFWDEVFTPWELQQTCQADWFITNLCSRLRVVMDGTPAPIDDAAYHDITSHAKYLVRYMKRNPDTTAAVVRDLFAEAPQPTQPGCSFFKEELGRCLDSQSLAFIYRIQSEMPLLLPPRELAPDAEDLAIIGRLSQWWLGDAVKLPPFGWIDALDPDSFGSIPVQRPLVAEPPVPVDEHPLLELFRSTGMAFWDLPRGEEIKRLPRLRALRTGWLNHYCVTSLYSFMLYGYY